MVKIRLLRVGANKHPFYRIVVADVRAPRDGRHIEVLGFYNPVARGKEEVLRLDLERVKTWIGQGAQATARVKSLIKTAETAAQAA